VKLSVFRTFFRNIFKKCLVQQTRIMEQIREMKKVDLDLFHFESICQNQTDEQFDQNDEILRLEHLYRLTERIIDLHNVSYCLSKNTKYAKISN